jgi:hypothetical protein
MRLPSFFGWYRILRGSYHLSVFEAVRSSLMAGALVRLGHRNQQQLRLRLVIAVGGPMALSHVIRQCR